MHRLIFETPSKRCPMRHMNGQTVRIVQHLNARPLRRQAGELTRQYLIQFADAIGFQGVALADELFIVPDDHQEAEAAA